MEKEISYDPYYFDLLFHAETKHFWFVTRNEILSSLVNRLLLYRDAPYKILEIGCGTGNVLNTLTDRNSNRLVIGMDLFREGLKISRLRGNFHTIQADVFQAPFQQSIDLVGLFDVLEHFNDDLLVLDDVKDILTTGGYLILTVPAFSSLWSYFDEEAHHARRYSETELIHKLEKVGYRVCYSSYYMLSIFPFLWLARKIGQFCILNNLYKGKRTRKGQVENELRVVPIVNGMLRLFLSWEITAIKKGKRLPFGTSVLAVAQKVAVDSYL